MEFVIRHDGQNWIAEHGSFRIIDSTLDGVDAKIGDLLRSNGIVVQGQSLRVFIRYDISTIPAWIRQYSQHYFNRIIQVEG